MAVDDRHQSNRLLARLPATSLSRLAPLLEVVALTPGNVLAEPGRPLQHAVFPHTGVICLMAPMQDGLIEAATIGSEGFLGAEALLGGCAGQRALVQLPGTASRVSVPALHAEVHENPALHALLLRYLQCFMDQAMQSAACNAVHTVQQRCARWLLMAQDRAGTDSFRLTQEALATLLGIQRPSVTIVAGALRDEGLISYHRGQITVTDRRGLEAASCGCYAQVKARFAVAFGPAPTRRRRQPRA